MDNITRRGQTGLLRSVSGSGSRLPKAYTLASADVKQGVSILSLFCLIGLLISLSLYSHAGFPQTAPPDPEDPDALTAEESTAADSTHKAVSRSINNAARWIDSFFDDDTYIAEDATTTLRLAQGVFLERGESPRYKTRVNVKFKVPRLKHRLSVFAGGEEDDERTSDAPINSLQDTTNDPFAGVQYFAKATNKLNLSLTAGVKFDSAQLFVGPRLRRTFSLGTWNLRFIQRVRWLTDNGWEVPTRFDLETLLNDQLFFRNTVEGRWREKDDGYRYEIRPTLIQRLANKTAIEYQWSTVFETRPNHRLDQSVASIRFRRQIWRKWLFYEIDPQIAFRNDDDFDPKAGVTLGLEVVFGGKDRSIRLRRTSESHVTIPTSTAATRGLAPANLD